MKDSTLNGGGATPQRGQPSPYGPGVKTVTMRVPIGMQSYLKWCAMKLPQIINSYDAARKPTRSWDKMNQLMAELLASQQLFIDMEIGDDCWVEYRGITFYQFKDGEDRTNTL